MKKSNMIKMVVGILCIVLVATVALVGLVLDGRPLAPIVGIFQSEEEAPKETKPVTEPTQEETPTEESLTDDPVEESAPTTTPTEPTQQEEAPTEESLPGDSGEETEPTTKPSDPTMPEEKPTDGSDSGEDTTPTTNPTEPTQQEEIPEETGTPSKPSWWPDFPQEEIPSDEPIEGGSTVVIPGEKDPETGSTELQFPCQIPEYDLVIEKLDAYGGLFVEDGSNGQVENVAMLMIHNQGDVPIEYTQISVQVGQEQLLFHITALPAGEKMVVQEKSGKPMPEGTASAAKALVVQGADMEMSEELVRVTDNGDNTLTVQNLTNKTIPTVRVFYKYYMEDENIFVGGIAFTLRITRLGPGAAVTVQPSHYNSATSRVVMVLTYDSEV